MAENIFLIGFMGAGKSTIAKVLKEKLNVPLCEMDEMIAEQQKMAISDILHSMVKHISEIWRHNL